MNIDQYLSTLPKNIIGGDSVSLPDQTVRRMLDFAELKPDETFCHLGCGSGYALQVAKQYGARICGIDIDESHVRKARHKLGGDADVYLGDVRYCRIPPADVILFWFADPKVTHVMPARFSKLDKDTRIITVWGPLPGCLPDSVQFPFILNTVPFCEAPDMKSQIRAVFGVSCVSYATAWEYAERYTKALQPDNSQNDRFLTILQALTIWYSAHSLGVTCEDGIPESVSTYTTIMRNFFDIDFGHHNP